DGGPGLGLCDLRPAIVVLEPHELVSCANVLATTARHESARRSPGQPQVGSRQPAAVIRATAEISACKQSATTLTSILAPDSTPTRSVFDLSVHHGSDLRRRRQFARVCDREVPRHACE